MAKTTRIDWADATFSPWQGCSKVSPGCENCYEHRWAMRCGLDINGSKPRRLTADSTWKELRKWNAECLRENKRMTVFPSLCDPFDESVDARWLGRYLVEIWSTGALDHLVLTKRPDAVFTRLKLVAKAGEGDQKTIATRLLMGERFYNMHFGISVEDHHWYQRRALAFFQLPSRLKFISYEPALGPLFLNLPQNKKWIHWVIAGGESGPGRRTPEIEWFQDVQDQCEAEGVPFFMKQDAGPHPGEQGRIPDWLWNIKQFPKFQERLTT